MVRQFVRVYQCGRMGSARQTLYISALFFIARFTLTTGLNYTVAVLNDSCRHKSSDVSDDLENNLENSITLRQMCPTDSVSRDAMFKDDDIDVFIGSLNFTYDSEMRQLAELYSRPYVTPYSSLPYSDNAQAFPLSANFVQMSRALKAILTYFRWKHVVVISVYDGYWMEMGTGLFVGLSEAGFKPSMKYIRDHVPGFGIDAILNGITGTQKAIVLCVEMEYIHSILRQADLKQLARNHAFFVFSLSPYIDIMEDDYMQLMVEHEVILESLFVIHPKFKVTQDIRDKRSIREATSDSDNELNVIDMHQGDILTHQDDVSTHSGDVLHRPRRLVNDQEDDELIFHKDAVTVIDRLFTIRSENNSTESQHLFQALTNTTVKLSCGKQTITHLAEIDFEFLLYDFDSDNSKFKKVQNIVLLRAGNIELTGLSTITWPYNEPLEADVCFLPDDCQTKLFRSGTVLIRADPELRRSLRVTFRTNLELKRSPRTVLDGHPGRYWMVLDHHGLDALYILAIAIAVLFVAGVATAIIIMVWRKVIHREMSKGHQKVLLNNEDLVFLQRKDVQKGSKILNGNIPEKPDLLKASEKPNRSLASLHEYEDLTDTARYNGDLVHVKELKVKGFEMKSKVLSVIKQLREVRHENVNAFIGFYEDPQKPAIISDYCIRGSLGDVLRNTDIKLDWDFKLSLLTDLIRAVRFVHNSTIRWHGNLKPRNCVIDSRWVLKVTDYGLPIFYEAAKLTPEFTDIDLLYTAPEHLRHPVPPLKGSEKGDVYSVAIIMQCVVLRTEPYSTSGLAPKDIIQKLRNPPPLLRPSVSHGAAPPSYIQIMKVCWSENPDMRPTIEEIYQQYKTITGGKKTNIVDTMFRMLEKYSNDLEDLVRDRTMQLEEEKKKTDLLLYRMLPPTVADNLKVGSTVAAETFSEVTIYFSDIVGFTTISANSTPMQVVSLLNDLYTMFDATIDSYDVYKVETIGDAYMVSSGLPLRNGNRHAGEISTMALDLLCQCGDFTITHMPEVPLRVRIGLHSGSCVAGVVGLTMPRYCLFGDTVNTASRMETTGAAYRIHISHSVKEILDVLGGYHIDYRGEVELKGKGMAKTYWLIGKEGFDKKLPEPPPIAGLSLEEFRLGRKISGNQPASPIDACDKTKTLNKSGIKKDRKDLISSEVPDSPLFRHPIKQSKKVNEIIVQNGTKSQNIKAPPVLYPSVIHGNAVMADKIIEERVSGNNAAQQIIHTVTIHSPREAGLTTFTGSNHENSHLKESVDDCQRKVSQSSRTSILSDGVKHNKKHKTKLKKGSNTVSPSHSTSVVSLSEDINSSDRKSPNSYHENSSIKLAFEESLV